MGESFDIAAHNYDEVFTHSIIGKAQRKLIRNHFINSINKNAKNVLEINCGTGEDAIWLINQNYNVIATDISENMISIANTKVTHNEKIFEVLDCKEIEKRFSPNSFDLIFSNFGGLNCLSQDELQLFFKSAKKILTEKGQLILVIMPKNTLWEQFYFLLKGKFSLAYRRKKEMAIANVDGIHVKTYYYNPKNIATIISKNYEIKNYKPIGFFIPPSYLEKFFKKRTKLLAILNFLENRITNFSFLSKYSDHYLLTLQKK